MADNFNSCMSLELVKMTPSRARVKEPPAGLGQVFLNCLGKKLQSEFVFQLLEQKQQFHTHLRNAGSQSLDVRQIQRKTKIPNLQMKNSFIFANIKKKTFALKTTNNYQQNCEKMCASQYLQPVICIQIKYLHFVVIQKTSQKKVPRSLVTTVNSQIRGRQGHVGSPGHNYRKICLWFCLYSFCLNLQ